MNPWSSGGLLTHHFGGWHGDEEGLRWWFPSPAGCREELLDPPDLGWMTAAAWSMFRGKVFGPFRVFSIKGIYRRNGDVRRWTRGPHHLVARPGGGPRHPMVRLPPGCSPSLLWAPSSWQVNRNFDFRFVQFWKYFLCNFSETQNSKKQELALWHLVNRLVPENA
jgi:hypothetical protein